MTKLTADCGAKTQIKMGELIRCRECGHRVMYKPRTHKSESRHKLMEGRNSVIDEEGTALP